MKSNAVAAFSSVMGGPIHANPMPPTSPKAVAEAGTAASVESKGGSMRPAPLPSVTAVRLEASTFPVNARIEFSERRRAWQNH